MIMSAHHGFACYHSEAAFSNAIEFWILQEIRFSIKSPLSRTTEQIRAESICRL